MEAFLLLCPLEARILQTGLRRATMGGTFHCFPVIPLQLVFTGVILFPFSSFVIPTLLNCARIVELPFLQMKPKTAVRM